MILVRQLSIIFCCSVCCTITSSCATTAPDFTDRIPSFVCEQKYKKCVMVVGIESSDNCIVKRSEPILADPQDAIGFLCGCHLKRVRNVKFFGMYYLRLYYGDDEYDLLVLSKSKKVIKFNGIIYKLKEKDAKKLDKTIMNMIEDKRLVQAQTDCN